MAATKVARLRRPWPLLADTQCPDSSEARLAYHLHRLNLSSNAICEQGAIPRSIARHLRQARRPLTDAELIEIAVKLAIHPRELSRKLRPPERNAWDFYRVSARHVPQAWSTALGTAEMHGIPLRAVASAARIHSADLSRIIAGTSLSPAMTWPMASRIARLLPQRHTPWRFLEGLARHPYPPEETSCARTAH